MSFLANIGYRFKIPGKASPKGSVILCCGMPFHQLLRRNPDKEYPHLHTRFFDPQLYLSTLDPNETPKICAYLASYPWFNVQGIQEYQSDEITQSSFNRNIEKQISELWPRDAIINPALISKLVRQCIDFQLSLKCKGIILPSPLTVDPNTSYDIELLWLDEALEYISRLPTLTVPVYATVAISDLCLRYTRPNENSLLSLILDAITAREVDGVYLATEQASEPLDTRNCGNTKTLQSLLHLVYLFSNDAGLKVIVN